MLQAIAELGERGNVVKLPAASVKFHAPIVDPRKIVCVGLNYKDHAAESGAAIPKDPILFSKYRHRLDRAWAKRLSCPKSARKSITRRSWSSSSASRGGTSSSNNALDHVAGYTVGHDVSARDWQLKKDGKQWMVGKTFDTFAPRGRVLVTRDEVPDPLNLPIRLRLNGADDAEQQHETDDLRRGGAGGVLSQVFTLEPGDLIYTGTPPGVGMARKPPVYLKDGDVVEVEIEGLGVLRNPVAQEK